MGTIEPIMGTNSDKQRHDAADYLFGLARRKLLSLFYSRPDEYFFLRQITRILGSGHGMIQRELSNLVRAGLIIRKQDGRSILYSANTRSEIFSELQSILLKTSALATKIALVLEPLRTQIDIAFIFGSMATGRQNKGSDVDLYVIGTVPFDSVIDAILPVEKEIGREINPLVYSEQEFRMKFESGSPFHRNVMESRKIFLIGNENELQTLAR